MDMGFSAVACSQMGMTLHAYSAPLRFMGCYFDYIMCAGMAGVVSLGVERLRREEGKVMGYGMEEVGRYLRTWREELEGTPEERVRGAHGNGVDRRGMRELEVRLRGVILKEQLEGTKSSGGIGMGKKECWKERYGVTWEVSVTNLETVRTLFRNMDTEVGSDRQVLRDKITKVSRVINRLHEDICRAKLEMMGKVEAVDRLQLEKFELQRAVEGMVKNAGLGGGKNKALLDSLASVQRKAGGIESRLSACVTSRDSVVFKVKELTMEYEENVEVKDGFCKALQAVCERYERKREEVVGKIARTESNGSDGGRGKGSWGM
ncbi:hypothetical protein TrRE_jg2488 [Triparma retinervis]|uniref:Uncharacterized protein n=1 Tax=Triparma retinervis TaxID=2557542 RepID=A0A9W7G4T0_9STRA|nr:hypothetical protein TrRE_jg2488 [Triparma retinervis]